jgi:hypothetical protein
MRVAIPGLVMMIGIALTLTLTVTAASETQHSRLLGGTFTYNQVVLGSGFLPAISTVEPCGSEVTASYFVPGPERQLAACVKNATGKLNVTVKVILGVIVDGAIVVNVAVAIIRGATAVVLSDTIFAVAVVVGTTGVSETRGCLGS